jgi:hypothetical protein
MRRTSYGLVGTLAGLVVVSLAQNRGLLPPEGPGPLLIFAPLIGAIIGNILGRSRPGSG